MVLRYEVPADTADQIVTGWIEKPRALTYSCARATTHHSPRLFSLIRPRRNHAPRTTHHALVYWRHAFRHLSRHLRRKTDSRAQRLRHVAGARRRDAAVRVRRGHPAPDDALRGELCALRDLLHPLSRRSFSGRHRTDPHAGSPGACGADDVVRSPGCEEGARPGDPARGGTRSIRGDGDGGEGGRHHRGRGTGDEGRVRYSGIRDRGWWRIGGIRPARA